MEVKNRYSNLEEDENKDNKVEDSSKNKINNKLDNSNIDVSNNSSLHYNSSTINNTTCQKKCKKRLKYIFKFARFSYS